MELTDCHGIIYKGRHFTSQDYKEVHMVCMSWLSKTLKESTATKKIVVTYHCPTLRFRDPGFIESDVDSAFCVSLDNFIEISDINYWMFGHTHYNGGTDTKLRTATLLTNQLG